MTSAGRREADGPLESPLMLALPAAKTSSAWTSEVIWSLIAVEVSMIDVLDQESSRVTAWAAFQTLIVRCGEQASILYPSHASNSVSMRS